jgi:hypothetical protein
MSNELMLSVVLGGVGLYFAVMVGRAGLAYARFRRVRPTALLTWPARRPPHFGMLVGLGVLAAWIAVLNGYMRRPFSHVLSQVVMSLYFILMVPLMARIRVGFYRDGVFAEGGFLPWSEIGRWAFRETPEIVLVLLSRAGSALRLTVPPAEYGAVRKVLEERARAHVLNVETGLLGL